MPDMPAKRNAPSPTTAASSNDEPLSKVPALANLDTRESTGAAPAEAVNTGTSELWMGDIPKKYAKTSVLRNILYKVVPRGVQQPAVKKLVRKGYKNKGSNSSSAQKGGYLGFAILTFSAPEDAQAFLAQCNGMVVGDDKDYTLRLQPANAPANKRRQRAVELGKDPPHIARFNGYSKEALVQRWDTIRRLKDSGSVSGTFADQASVQEEFKFTKKKELVHLICNYYKELGHAPTEVAVEGHPIPASLADSLRAELDCLKWSATKHRKISAQHYLVLKRKHQQDVPAGQDDESQADVSAQEDAVKNLHRLANKLMAWADPEGQWTHIAVTKNFIGAPHIDNFDISHQYAVSLGDFDDSKGGQLCVDSWHETQDATTSKHNLNRIFVVNTKNKIARMDGRYLHWVRTYDARNKSRYSLIFYQTTGEGTPLSPQAVDVEWRPATSAQQAF